MEAPDRRHRCSTVVWPAGFCFKIGGEGVTVCSSLYRSIAYSTQFYASLCTLYARGHWNCHSQFLQYWVGEAHSFVPATNWQPPSGNPSHLCIKNTVPIVHCELNLSNHLPVDISVTHIMYCLQWTQYNLGGKQSKMQDNNNPSVRSETLLVFDDWCRGEDLVT